MSHLFDLEDLDADGAIRECAEAAGFDRADLLKKGALAGGGLLAGNALLGAHLSPAHARISSRRSKRNDVKILNYALTLEFLEAEFYARAVANDVAGDNAELKRFADVVAEHEAQHVAFLRNALGSSAIKKPKFEFGASINDRPTFAKTAQVLEDTGVSAYLGQVRHIAQKGVLKAAGTIATVEARHAAWIRFINGATPAPADFDRPRPERFIRTAVGDLGFIELDMQTDDMPTDI